MNVRLGGISRIATLAEHLPSFDLVAGPYFDSSLLEMRQHRNLIFAMLNDCAIADAGVGIHGAWDIIPDAFNYFGHSPVRRRKHIAAEGIIILIFLSLAVMSLFIRSDSEHIKGELLVEHVMMIIQLPGVPSPKNQPSLTKRQR